MYFRKFLVRDHFKELVTKGKISKRTQRTANMDIFPIPFFSILKKFKWFKEKALEKMKLNSL